MAKVSIIVPIYRVESVIERCAHSLFSQTLDDLEYLFIDDCSPDNSLNILMDVLSKYPHRREQVNVLTMPCNSGTGAVRLKGLQKATGDYVIHCDSDDWVDNNYYEVLYNTATSTNADIVVSDFIREYPSTSVLIKTASTDAPKLALQQMHQHSFYCMLWNKLIRRELLIDNNIRTIPGMDMWEDVFVTIQAYYFANRVAKAENVYYHYCDNASSYTAKSANQKSYNQRKMCIQTLSVFFANKSEDWSLLLNFWKLLAKSYLLHPLTFNARKWRNEYPEAYTDLALMSGFSNKDICQMRLTHNSPALSLLYNLPGILFAHTKRIVKSAIR